MAHTPFIIGMIGVEKGCREKILNAYLCAVVTHSGPVRATRDNSREIEWDVAISWQLRGHTWRLFEGYHVHPVTATKLRGSF